MKVFKNRQTEIKDGNEFLTFFDLAKACLNYGPQGFAISEIQKRLRVLNVLNGQEEAQVEDADFETLSTCVNQMQWGLMHPDILAFWEYLQELKK